MLVIVEEKLELTVTLPRISLTAAAWLPCISRVPPESVSPALLRTRSLLAALVLSRMSDPPKFTVMEATLGKAPAPLRITAPPAALTVRAPEKRAGAVRFKNPAPTLLMTEPGTS